MKVIKDIRIYKDKQSYIGNKRLNLAAHRVAMKLREKEFSLGDYDHLYICFTTDIQAGSIVPEEEADKYFPWFRRVHVGVSDEEMQAVETVLDESYLLDLLLKVLLGMYGMESSAEEIIRYAAEEARKGRDMLMLFKEKKATKGTATIYLRLSDNGRYFPLLVVTKPDGTQVLREDLPETSDLGSIGEIQLSSKKVTVKPRKNSYTKNLEPVSFEISL